MKAKLLACSCCLIWAVARAAEFSGGERIVCLGDSITHQGYYLHALTDWLLTDRPGSGCRIYSAGVGGDTADLCRKRLWRDVSARKPTVVAIMFGMNDAIKGKSPDDYGDDLEKLHRQIGADNPSVRFVWMTPTPYDDRVMLSGKQSDPRKGVAQRLAEYAEVVRKIRRRLGGNLVDFHVAMSDFNWRAQTDNPAFTLCGTDRIHPREQGGFFMACVALRDLRLRDGIPADVQELKAAMARAEGSMPTGLRKLNAERWRKESALRHLHMVRWQLEVLQKRDADDFETLKKLEESFGGRHGQFEDRVRLYLRDWPRLKVFDEEIDDLWSRLECRAGGGRD